MNIIEKEIRDFERDIKRLQKLPKNEGNDLLISFYQGQIRMRREEMAA